MQLTIATGHKIAGQVHGTQDAACLQCHAGMIIRVAREVVPEPDELAGVEVAFTAATHALQC